MQDQESGVGAQDELVLLPVTRIIGEDNSPVAHRVGDGPDIQGREGRTGSHVEQQQRVGSPGHGLANRNHDARTSRANRNQLSVLCKRADLSGRVEHHHVMGLDPMDVPMADDAVSRPGERAVVTLRSSPHRGLRGSRLEDEDVSRVRPVQPDRAVATRIGKRPVRSVGHSHRSGPERNILACSQIADEQLGFGNRVAGRQALCAW
jgi:hypothetical protein